MCLTPLRAPTPTLPQIDGRETHSVSVIDGKTTIETHERTSTMRVAEGSIPGESADNDAPWSIPESWITRTAADGRLVSSGGEENETGSYTFANTGLRTHVTTTEVELDDGTLATEKSIVTSWYIEFTWRTGGEIGADEEDTSSDDGDSGLPDGATADLSINYQLYANASIGGHFTITTVTEHGDILPTETSTSWGFAVAALVGGSMTTEYSVSLDESAGSEAEGTDTYHFIDTTDTLTLSGSAGFSFWVAGGLGGESDSDNETVAEPKVGFWPGSKHLDKPAGSDSKPGGQSAQELLDDNSWGIQFTAGVDGSYTLSKEYTYRERTRDDVEESVTTTSFTDNGSNGSGANVRIAAGTAEVMFSLGGHERHTIDENSSFEFEDGGDNGQEHGDTLVFRDNENYSNKSESEWSWSLTLGGETQYEKIDDGEYDVDVTLITDNQVIHNGSMTGYRYVHIYRDYSDVEVLQLGNSEELPQKVDRLIEIFTSLDGQTVTEIHNQAPGGDPPGDSQRVEEILADYRAAKEQELRLQALSRAIARSSHDLCLKTSENIFKVFRIPPSE